MMSQRNAVRTVAVCLVMLALGSATSGYPAMAQGTVTLRLSHDHPVTHPNTFQLEVFARLVEQRSKGTLKVTTFPAGQLFSETDVLPALERGEVDIALLQPSKVASVVPAMLITELPFIFTSWDQFHTALDGEMGQIFVRAMEADGIKTLFWVDVTSIDLFGTRSKLVRRPEDARGLRLRSFSEALAATMRLWGAAPTVIPSADVYSAVQRGVVDGLISGVSFVERRWYEVTPYISYIPITFTSQIIGMNLRKWNSLSPEQQQILMQAAAEVQRINRRDTPQTNADAYRRLKTGLVKEWYEATPADLALWRKAAAGMEEWYLQRVGPLGPAVLKAAKSTIR